jgi:hypothetical protein
LYRVPLKSAIVEALQQTFGPAYPQSDFRDLHVSIEFPDEVTRWRFAGSLSFTIGAFSSLERDRLFDELVGVFSFANVDDTQISTFKTSVEQNDFLGINVQYDILTVSGDATNSGTPWGTDDEIIYEITLSTDVIGEYVSDPATNQLVLLSDILVEGYRSDQPKPDFPDQPPITGVPYDPSQWI